MYVIRQKAQKKRPLLHDRIMSRGRQRLYQLSKWSQQPEKLLRLS